MAIYIQIRKISEDQKHADFAFSLENEAQGTMRLQKESGEVVLLTPLPGDTPERGLFARAAHKVCQHWRKGELPELTTWAS